MTRTSERWKAKNPALRGRDVTLCGGQAQIDAYGLLPVDMSPEQLEHARRCGLFECVKVTRASVIKDELAAHRTKLAELERATDQAFKVFGQWRDRYDEARAVVGQLEDELAAIEADQGVEPPAPIPPPHVDVDELTWEGLKDAAREHGVPIGKRTKDEIKADVAAAFAKGTSDTAPPAGDAQTKEG